MTVIANQTGIAETPEALRAKRSADKAFEESGKKYDDDPSLAGKEQASIRESLGYGKFSVGTNEPGSFEDKEDTENPDDVLSALDDVDDMPLEDVDGAVIDTGNEIVEAKETITGLEAHKDHPACSIVERFNMVEAEYGEPPMGEEDFSQLRSILGEEFSLDALSSALTECEIKDPIVKKNLGNYIEQAKKLNPKQSEVGGEEVPEIPSRWKGIDLLNKPEDPTIQLLATSFIELPTGQDGQPNFEADIQTAFDKAVSITTLGKSFPQGEAYDIALKDIHSGDLETKLGALTYITSLVNTEQAKGGMKNKQDFQKAKTTHTNKKKAYLDFKIEQLNTQIAETNDQEEKNKLGEEYAKLLQEKEVEDFPESGEVFAASDIDLATASV